MLIPVFIFSEESLKWIAKSGFSSIKATLININMYPLKIYKRLFDDNQMTFMYSHCVVWSSVQN